MKGQVTINFDLQTGKMAVYGPMETQDQKDMTIKILSAAINIVTDYKYNALIKPNGDSKPITPVKAPIQ